MDFFEQAMGGGMSRGPGKDVQVGPCFHDCFLFVCWAVVGDDVVSSAPNLILYLPVVCVTCFVTVRCVVTWQLQSVSIVGSLLCVWVLL
jgi:hypothetical protein